MSSKDYIQKTKQARDPGLGEKYEGRTKRIINKDGSFNVEREGGGFSPADSYLLLTQMSWFRFLFTLLVVYCLLNSVFAVLYLFGGVENISGAKTGGFFEEFQSAFFFSVQTFTTVGYGAMSPTGAYINIVASIEAMAGFLSFALATGLMYGRFSKPSARILFSKNAIISPYQDTNSLQFRIVNQRSNILMNMNAEALLSVVEQEGSSFNRKYYRLQLETNRINFFPLNWTLVHKIDDDSPLFGRTEKDLQAMGAEILILIKGFDDSFGQTVHKRFSYDHDEIVWGAKFSKAFHISEEGDVVMDVRDIHEYHSTSLN